MHIYSGLDKKNLERLKSLAGAALAELAIVLPLTLIFTTGGYETWKVIRLYDELEALTASAARFASLQNPPRAEIEERTRNYIEHLLLPSSPLGHLPHSDFDIKIERLTGTDWDSPPYGTVSPGDTLRVRINLDINNRGQFKSYLLGGDTVTLAKSYIHINDRLVGVPQESG